MQLCCRSKISCPNYNALILNQVGEITLTCLYAMSYSIYKSSMLNQALAQEIGFVDQNVFPCFQDVTACIILKLFYIGF